MSDIRIIKERQKEIYYSGYLLRYSKEYYKCEIPLTYNVSDGTYYYADVKIP